MPRILKDLTINEVSSVDRGAGRGVKVLLMKRDFTQEERDAAAKSGASLPDGSFPIVTVGDLENAVQALGRAKDPAKAKAHIIARAKTLGATDKLPDDWKVAKALNPGEIEMTEAELKELVAKSAAEAVTKALEVATKANAAELAKRDHEITLLKMSDAHKAYMGTCDEATQKSFADMTPEARDAFMTKNPVKKVEAPALVADLAKRDEAIAKLNADNVELRKRLDASDLEKSQVDFKKRAADVGLTAEGDGELMRKAFKGDAEAQVALEKRQAVVFAALTKQVETSKLFGEIGTTKGAAGSALQAMNAKATELRKTEKGASLTEAQAFTKVYEDPENATLVAQHKVEEARGRMQVVA